MMVFCLLLLKKYIHWNYYISVYTEQECIALVEYVSVEQQYERHEGLPMWWQSEGKSHKRYCTPLYSLGGF